MAGREPAIFSAGEDQPVRNGLLIAGTLAQVRRTPLRSVRSNRSDAIGVGRAKMRGRKRGESHFIACRGISAALSDPVCDGDVLPTRGEMTMSTKLAMAFAAVIVALALPALAAGNGNRDNEHTYKLAQYCIPQHDELPGATRVYC
jgi:hypothetical protein